MTENGKTVLIVEDSPSQASALTWLLQQEGLRVLHASNGRIGVDMAQQHTPDAIILDIEMPEMNGFETCRRLKEHLQTASIPIMMFTVRGEPAAVLEGLDRGAIDFIPKDAFSGSVILETLRQLHILDDTTRGVERC
jgi:two-component system cell cycle response regulator